MELAVGKLPHGKRNLISDVPGVRVGHATVDRDGCHTGVTVILPPGDNPFVQKRTAACQVFNGFGKSLGLVQLEELGTLETPIALTNTLNVGRVHDALVSYMLDICRRDQVSLTSVNPVVCECNDSLLSDIARRPVREAEVFSAIFSASEDFSQGAVGAGRGTVCYGLKGGIGSASRLMGIGGETFTLGVLVQSNYGTSSDLSVASLPEGLAECDRGSIILILATDLPLSARQLRRVLRRTSLGMARLGSIMGHGSGEIAVGFTTAPRQEEGAFLTGRILREENLDLPFRAAAECAQEAILQSMLHAEADTARDGRRIGSLREYLTGCSQAPGQ